MNRLQRFHSNPSIRQAYKDAIRVLQEIGVDSLLLELSFGPDINPAHPNIVEANALDNQRRLGYVDCINALFNLAEITPDRSVIKMESSYDAVESLVKQGRLDQDEIPSEEM